MTQRSLRTESLDEGSLNQLLKRASESESIDLEETLGWCVSAVCNLTGWPVGHVVVPVSDGGGLGSAGIWHAEPPDTLATWREARTAATFAAGQGLPGAVWQRREAVALKGTGDDGDGPLAGIQPAPASAFGFPVMCADELVAVLEFFHPEAEASTAQLRPLASCLGLLLGQLAERSRRAADRSRLVAIIEASDDAVISTDGRGIIVSWNAGAERLYGYTREEAIGGSLALIVPDQIKESAPVISRVLREALRLNQFETIRRRKDGQLVDVSLTASPIFDRAGNVTGASSIERDITRRKRFEAERAKAQADAESANRSKSEFLANVSHELRTPMSAILGMLELSLSEELPATVTDYLATAHDSAQVLLFLLNDLLDFSRAESGTFELEPSPFVLRKTIDQAARTLAVRAHEKGLELLCRVRDDVPDNLVGDGRRLQQIVMNLAGNAIKFTDSGEIVIDVALAALEQHSIRLLISVTDTGIGIAPADQQRIFSPFTQVDASSTRKYSGTGLGLAITRELVNRMHGRLWVESEFGEGSRFYCTLRLKRGLDERPRTSIQEAKARLAGKSALIVDDNLTSRQFLTETLRDWSMQPTVCNSGAEALDVLRGAAPDAFPLLIVDALMPRMDGFMLIENARRESVLRDAKIVMLSSSNRPSSAARNEQLGITAHLEKPISPSVLLQTLSSALGGRDDTVGRGGGLTTAARPLRILVAEDTPANQKVVGAILSKRGHKFEIVNNGQEAVDRIQKAAFDVVLMDAQMPTMNGLQAAAAIRHIPHAERARVPIIAMTAHAMREDRDRCLAAGMDDYLPKPIDARELIKVVEFHANRHNEPVAPRDVKAPTRDELAADAPSLDLEAAAARFGGNQEILSQLIELFRNDAGRQVDAMRAALDARDLSTAARAAHNLRGSALSLDAAPTVHAAAAVEEAADAGNSVAARAALVKLEAELARLLQAIDAPPAPLS